MNTPSLPPSLPPHSAPSPLPTTPVRRRRNWLAIGLVGVLGLCGLCGFVSLLGAIAGGGIPTATVAAGRTAPTITPAGTVVAAGGANPTATPRPTTAAIRTSTPRPEPTPRPTNTPRPEPTIRPTSLPPRPPAAYGLNEIVSVKNWNLAVVAVERPGKELIWSRFGNKTPAVGTWIVVVVDMENTGNENFGVNTFDFELRSAGEITHKFSSEYGAFVYSEFKGGQRIGGQVPPGVVVRYHLVFDVAPNATNLRLVFKQDTNPIFAVGDAAP